MLVDPRDHQSRYKRFGLSYEYFVEKIKKLNDFRNDYDVAHYSIVEDRLEEVEAAFGEASSIVSEVLQQYRDHLLET
jgi:hypothetical protein